MLSSLASSIYQNLDNPVMVYHLKQTVTIYGLAAVITAVTLKVFDIIKNPYLDSFSKRIRNSKLYLVIGFTALTILKIAIIASKLCQTPYDTISDVSEIKHFLNAI